MLRSTLVKILKRSVRPTVVKQNCRRQFQNKPRSDVEIPVPILQPRFYSSTTGLSSSEIEQDVQLQVDTTAEIINLKFKDNRDARYPFVWLRDNCQCSECHDESSRHRILLLETLDLDVHPINTELQTNNQSVMINWSDGHKSEYPLKWLKDVKFPASMDPIDGLGVKYWGSEMTKEKTPTFSFHGIMSEESCLYSWLASLHTYGFSIVIDLGNDDKNLIRLADRVAYLRVTCYGKDFAVKSNPEPTNLAYTGYRLCLHTDLPFYTHEPGIQILHCIKRSDHGGSSEFSDAFKVAYELQRQDPETFEILSTVPISFVDQGIDEISKTNYVLSDWKPIIRLDRSGHIQQVNFNNHVRGIQMSVGHQDIKKVYRALAVFNSALYNEDNFTSLSLQEGEAACFNNTRVLHGRSAFTVPPGCQTPRHLQGIYIDWDEIYARLRGIADKST